MIAYLVCGLLLAASASAQQGTGQHPVEPHVLDKFAFNAPVSFIDAGVRVTVNITTLYSTRTWVQVQVTGAPQWAYAGFTIHTNWPSAVKSYYLAPHRRRGGRECCGYRGSVCPFHRRGAAAAAAVC